MGQGAFGPVYKAKMPSGDMVAVKVLASDSKQGEKEFQTEVKARSKTYVEEISSYSFRLVLSIVGIFSFGLI